MLPYLVEFVFLLGTLTNILCCFYDDPFIKLDYLDLVRSAALEWNVLFLSTIFRILESVFTCSNLGVDFRIGLIIVLLLVFEAIILV